MAINFRKLKSQIKPFKPEVKDGYIFIATDEQMMKTSNVNLLYNNQVAYGLP